MDMDLEEERLVALPARLETSTFTHSPVTVNVTQFAFALNANSYYGHQHADAQNYSDVQVG